MRSRRPSPFRPIGVALICLTVLIQTGCATLQLSPSFKPGTPGHPRDPDLLILDEATSALDTNSERLVQQAIEQFERQHTVLVIAHRLSTIVNADLICVMEAGQIVERGSHQQLLAKGGVYAGLWRQQVQHSEALAGTVG